MASTKAVYNRWGEQYHAKRKNPRSSFWNDHIDYPAVSRLIRPLVKHRAVLDLGCGSGLFTRRLHRWGADPVTGLDVSSVLLAIARKENPRLTFVEGRATQLPFKAKSWDLVTSNLLIHYFKNVTPVFREVSRVLRDEGTFVFSFHHPMNEVMDLSRREKPSVAPYFTNHKYRWKMLEGKMTLVSYHHTFEAIVTALAKTGFHVATLLEPRPAPSSRRWDARSYRFATRYPTFGVVQAVKKR